MKHAKIDGELEQELLAAVAKRSGQPLRLEPFMAAFDEAACWDDEFVGHEESFEYVSGVEKVVDRYEGLLKDGHATAVMQLTEKALATMEGKMGSVNDSYGNVSGVMDRLQKLHHEACQKAGPDPEALARWIFDWKHCAEYGFLRDAPKPYADVLGKEGLAIYVSLTVHPKDNSGCPCGHLKGTRWSRVIWPDDG